MALPLHIHAGYRVAINRHTHSSCARCLLPPLRVSCLPNLQEFVDSAGEAGFVYASFGTICSVSAAELQAIAAALSTLPMRVLWKIKAEDLPEGLTFRDLRLGPNIKVVPTAPQNDVAAAPGLRAFLSHGGTGGVHEAAYNGVPLVGLPMIGDHFDNVMKAVHRGFGLLLDGRNVTKGEDWSAIAAA